MTVVPFESKEARIERQRRERLIAEAPDMVEGVVTDGIVWGPLTRPFPRATSMLVDLILDRPAAWRQDLKAGR